MKNFETDLDDDPRPEYDLSALRVRRVGAGRKNLEDKTIQLAPDVAEMFPDSESVNEASARISHQDCKIQ